MYAFGLREGDGRAKSIVSRSKAVMVAGSVNGIRIPVQGVEYRHATHSVEVVHAGARGEVDNEARRMMLRHLVRDDPRQLYELL